MFSFRDSWFVSRFPFAFPSLCLAEFNGVDDADNRRIHRTVLQAGRHACRTAADDEDCFADAGIHGVHGHEVTAFGFAARIHGTRDEQLAADQPGILPGRHHRSHDLCQEHSALLYQAHAATRSQAFAPDALPIGSTSSRFACGRGITWTDTSSPTRLAAAAPASVAAFTAATSPRTITVTKPPPTYSLPISVTLAALTMASAASIAPIRPLVSTMPSAIMAVSTGMSSSSSC